ncbi:Pro-neuregulin-3, membrane-bound isoform [Collichthys lucidus]|uniref:Pro-neuregulin-3, membrane-bound isoform n=1 Tax=Collichthys lucidus TaxID=240159 RepID=A0A4U5VNI9_COLLU|nr:Pro-neuregulin-3, membrane-bound isoform [Collichthys lucidus]
MEGGRCKRTAWLHSLLGFEHKKLSNSQLPLKQNKSGDTYQRQVLSIFSIASGICLLGVACMALYRRNKRHREKLQAHFSDSRSLRDCSVNASGLMSKSTPRLQYSLQLQKSCGSHGSAGKGGSVAPGTSAAAPPLLSKASKAKTLQCHAGVSWRAADSQSSVRLVLGVGGGGKGERELDCDGCRRDAFSY